MVGVSVSTMDRPSRQKTSKKKLSLSYKVDQLTPNRHIQNMPSKSDRSHILKCKWNVLQDRSCVKPQNKSVHLRRLKS